MKIFAIICLILAVFYLIKEEKICFSKMTFPHQLMRVILLEQLFRSFKISNNETYHR